MNPTKPTIAGTLLILAGCLSSHNAVATEWFYVEADVSRTTVDVMASQFHPILPRIKVGLAIYDGILLEAQYSGSGDDTVGNTNIGIDEITAAYLRLDTPVRSNMRMYVLLGSAETKLNVRGSGGATAGTDAYKDFSWGIGIEDRVWSRHNLLTLEYTEYYNHDEVVISAVSLGFKFEY